MSVLSTHYIMNILQYSDKDTINKVGYSSIELFHECLLYNKLSENNYGYEFYDYKLFPGRSKYKLKSLLSEYFDKFTFNTHENVSKTDYSDTLESFKYIENKIKKNEFNFDNQEIVKQNYLIFLDYICYNIFDLLSSKDINCLVKCKILITYLVEDLLKKPLFYIDSHNEVSQKIHGAIKTYVSVVNLLNIIKRITNIKIPSCVLPKNTLFESLDYVYDLFNSKLSNLSQPINYSNIYLGYKFSYETKYSDNYEKFIILLNNLQKYNNHFIRNFYLSDLKYILLNNTYHYNFDNDSILTFNNTSLNLYILNTYDYLYEIIEKYGLDWDIINKYVDMLLDRFCGSDYKVMVVMIDSVLSTMGKNDMEFNYSDYLVDFLINVGQKVKVNDIIQSNIFSIDEYKSLRVLSNGDFGNCYMFMRKRISEQFGNLSEAYNILEQNKFKTIKRIWT
jgi:hypothetical protein